MLIILILIILVLSSYFIATNIAYSEGKKHYSINNNDITLPDIGFKLLKDRRSSKNMYKIKECLFITYLILFLFLVKNNRTAIFEFAITTMIILFLKNVLFVCTILPDPSKKCKKANLLKLHNGGCYDLVISSHCVLLFVSLFVILQHQQCANTVIVYILCIFSIIIYLMLCLRQHYTTDVLNALFYSFFVYKWVQSNHVFSLAN